MKTIIICGAFFIAGFNPAFSQQMDSLTVSPQINPSLSLMKQHYLKKSRSQKTTAIVLGVGGAVFACAGLGIALNNFEGLFDPNDPPKNETLGDFLGYSGMVMIAASIPFYISAVKNRKKVFRMFEENNATTKVVRANFLIGPSPSLTLTVGL